MAMHKVLSFVILAVLAQRSWQQFYYGYPQTFPPQLPQPPAPHPYFPPAYAPYSPFLGSYPAPPAQAFGGGYGGSPYGGGGSLAASLFGPSLALGFGRAGGENKDMDKCFEEPFKGSGKCILVHEDVKKVYGLKVPEDKRCEPVSKLLPCVNENYPECKEEVKKVYEELCPLSIPQRR